MISSRYQRARAPLCRALEVFGAGRLAAALDGSTAVVGWGGAGGGLVRLEGLVHPSLPSLLISMRWRAGADRRVAMP